MRSSRRQCAALLALACCGCPIHSYRPTLRPKATAAGVQVEAESITYSPTFPSAGVDLAIRVRASTEQHIEHARVTAASTSPCADGVTASALQIQRGSLAMDTAPVLEPNTSSAHLFFPLGEVEKAKLFEAEPVALDLTLRPEGDPGGEQACLRLDLGGAGAAPEWNESPRFYGGAWVRGMLLPRAQLDRLALMTLTGGIRAGPARFGLEVGFAAAHAGFDGQEGAKASAKVNTGGITADAWLLGLGGSRLGLAGVGAFDVMYVSSRAGPDTATWYGPRLGLRLLWSPAKPPWRGFESVPGSNALGVEVYGTRLWSSGGETAWGFGIGFGGQASL